MKGSPVSAQDSLSCRYKASGFGCTGFDSWFTAGYGAEKKVFATVVAKESVGRDWELWRGRKIDLANWLSH